MTLREICYLVIALAYAAGSGCSRSTIQTSMGASGTEVSYCGVSGTAVDSNGKPVSGASVRLRPASYVWDSTSVIKRGVTIFDTTTDMFGGYRFWPVSADSYFVEINDRDSMAALQSFTAFKSDSSLRLDLDTLRPMVTISGGIEPLGNGGHCTIQILGLERRIRPDSIGRFEVRVPVGTYQIQFQLDSSDRRDSIPIYFMKVGVSLRRGERRHDIGVFGFGPGRKPPCNGYPCDSIAPKNMFDTSGHAVRP